jgi:hypothetical protein
VGLPYAPVQSLTVRPGGFATTAADAEAAAKATATMQSIHRRMHPLLVTPFVWSGSYWAIEFEYRGRVVAEVDVSRRGRVLHVWTGPLASAVFARGHYAPVFDSAWVVVPFLVLFLLPFLNLRRLRSWRLLDAVALLSFLVSYWLFDRGHVEAGVWAVYPPLVYLLARMLRVGTRVARPGPVLPRWLNVKVLAWGLLALVVARIALSLADAHVIDVGYASVIGASRLIHGQGLYYSSLAHPDTYGPITYLAYVPFVLIFPWHGTWDYLPAAHAAALTFDLVTIIALVVLGRRLRPGHEGTRLGLALGWAWAACPFTLLGLMEHTNDGLIAMLSVLALLVFASPAARGAVLGLAAAAKFSPAALLPLFAGRSRDRRGIASSVAAFLIVAVGSVALYLPSGGVSEFYDHTIGYQLTRSDVLSPWGLHPSLDVVKVALGIGAVLLALAVAIPVHSRTLVQVSALAAAVTIAVQLPAVHWFYYYIIWFMPFVLVALLGNHAADENSAASLRVTGPEMDEARRKPSLAGA